MPSPQVNLDRAFRKLFPEKRTVGVQFPCLVDSLAEPEVSAWHCWSSMHTVEVNQELQQLQTSSSQPVSSSNTDARLHHSAHPDLVHLV